MQKRVMAYRTGGLDEGYTQTNGIHIMTGEVKKRDYCRLCSDTGSY